MMAKAPEMKGAPITRNLRDVTVKVVPGDRQCRLLRLAALFNDLDDFRCLCRTHHATFRFDDPCLFPRNCRQRITENMRVLKFDRRNRCNRWRQHIGGIQTATEADFHHRNVDSLTGKMQKAQGGGELEKSEWAPCLTIAEPIDAIP
jgi:hypothetical protein